MKPRKINIGGSERVEQRERSPIGSGKQPASKQTVDDEAEHA